MSILSATNRQTSRVCACSAALLGLSLSDDILYSVTSVEQALMICGIFAMTSSVEHVLQRRVDRPAPTSDVAPSMSISMHCARRVIIAYSWSSGTFLIVVSFLRWSRTFLPNYSVEDQFIKKNRTYYSLDESKGNRADGAGHWA